MQTLYKIYLYIYAAATGACIGSFINVVAYRLPRGVFLKETRSYCPACKKTLKWRELIPILSYFLLKGRCRYCGAGIPMRYPAVEAVCALLALLCLSRYGLDIRTALSFGVSAILLAVALIDLDTMEIPNTLTLSLLPFALASVWAFADISPFGRVIGFFAVSLPMLLMAIAIPTSFGGGDIKLMAVCGFLLGWKGALLAFFIAVLTGGGYAVYLMASGKAKRGAHIAFGPHLCAGVFVSMLWGDSIIRAYLRLLTG